MLLGSVEIRSSVDTGRPPLDVEPNSQPGASAPHEMRTIRRFPLVRARAMSASSAAQENVPFCGSRSAQRKNGESSLMVG
jgi:hypothetical protein